MTAILDSIVRSQRYVSVQNGILKYIVRADRMNDDPRIISYGINPGNTTLLGGKKYLGQSSGCNYDKYNAYLSTIGETIERYCPAFYDISKMRKKQLQQSRLYSYCTIFFCYVSSKTRENPCRRSFSYYSF